jgi:putative endonuclease
VLVQIGFEDRQKAFAFEHYLKSGSGRAFAKKHF